MNVSTWFAGSSFHLLPQTIYHCEARKDGGAFLNSFRGHDAAVRVAEFRQQFEGWGYVVTVREMEVR